MDGLVIYPTDVTMNPIVAIAVLLVFPAAVDAEEKLDDGLDDADQTYAVFVRMTDQLFQGSGDYERFCEENASEDRGA